MALYKKENNTSYTLGITLTIELLKTKPNLVKQVYFHSNFEKKEAYELIVKLCQQHHINIVTSNKVFNVLSSKDNCYVIAEFFKFESNIDNKANHLVLVNPSDSGNLGTIMRSALGFNITNIIIINPGVDCFNPKSIRSSMGAIFHLNVKYFDSFDEYKEQFLPRDFFPFMLKANTKLEDIHSLKREKNYSLIFGNEATGLNDSFLNVGSPIIIKHTNKIDSLNLPIAVSIALYEVSKK